MPNPPCRGGCGGRRQPRRYLCFTCWHALPYPTRRALSLRDHQARARLRELHKQLDAGTPLAEIEVTP